MRWVMNQAAQTAKRSPDFAATYSSIAKRRGKKIATIAISRQAADPRLAPAFRDAGRQRQHAAAAAVKTGGSPSPG